MPRAGEAYESKSSLDSARIVVLVTFVQGKLGKWQTVGGANPFLLLAASGGTGANLRGGGLSFAYLRNF
jgi:hypothetical protein